MPAVCDMKKVYNVQKQITCSFPLTFEDIGKKKKLPNYVNAITSSLHYVFSFFTCVHGYRAGSLCCACGNEMVV